MMATNGALKTTVVLLSLIFPITAHTDHQHRPTSRMIMRQQTSDLLPGMRYSHTTNQSNFHTNPNSRGSYIDPEHQRRLATDEKIIYPDTDSNCTYGLCTNVTGYPKERIKQLLSTFELGGYFEAREDIVDLNNRFGSDESLLCDTMMHTVYPEKAKNTDKVEKTIVNVEGHKQGIVFETCVSDKECNFSKSFPDGYTSYCKQKFIHKRLMVLGENDKFVFDSFEVPSCCVCVLKKKTD